MTPTQRQDPGGKFIPIDPASGSGARRGRDVIERLRNSPPTLWYDGELIEDATTHHATKNGVHSLAALYDLQWSRPDLMLFDSPTSGAKVSRTFMNPSTMDELTTLSRAMKERADASFGMMGRAPDYLNRAVSGYAAGASFLGEVDSRFADNARKYHAYVREHDLCLTHTLVTPQANRSVGASKQADPYLAARVKEETADGIVMRGARMLATLPISDEIMVFPSTFLRNQEEDAPYAVGFCIPNNTPGLKFLCRESFDYGRSHYDHPLGSRFEELDAVVIFDDVFVPWERVMLYRDVPRCNQAFVRTGALAAMTHQVVVRDLAKTEFLMGLSSLIADTIAIESFQHIQEKLAEIWVNMETIRAFLRAAEADASLDEYGVMRPAWAPMDAARNLYPRLYPRMIEIIQQMSASGLMALPTAADINGPLSAEISRYFQAARADAHDRIPLFRLAWDTAVSAFGSRQVLYERFFFGDPVRMAGALVGSHDRTVYMDRVRAFLAAAKPEAERDASLAAVPIDPRHFRQTVGQFITGVAVIATEVDREIRAMTANSFTALSLDPPLVLFCAGKNTRTGKLVQSMKEFSVNILRRDQESLSTYFAGAWKEPVPPPFHFVPWEGGPRLEGCAAALACSKETVHEGGDHWIVIGHVLALHIGIEPRHPLAFFAGRYAGIKKDDAPAPDLELSDTPVLAFYDTFDRE